MKPRIYIIDGRQYWSFTPAQFDELLKSKQTSDRALSKFGKALKHYPQRLRITAADTQATLSAKNRNSLSFTSPRDWSRADREYNRELIKYMGA